ncbi:Glutamate synthase [NADPH] small chain [uncultured Roseburia sp.]|uniref:FAD-dependent oxidoreductase n=1 Tax=Brotonthovivens ammoniilytica TaxID=2981725 RepID=A0ABT2THW4_9FIRM|nr:FAD-dependent oxidoreductase [Brotonthovivens ammoniilytica]MCU6761793.1 FAD-dependent oxidoreductase [Brotonthovivens ammoniilytica]SCI46863.1 Glutamate synthase [NADPH] small chain [uncultured Roseburia sp.]
MAVITIDGIRLEVPDQKNVLDCALEAGIYIPHLCHHPDLPENGSCRMCVVEVEGQDEVVRSCMLKAEDGLNITTNSERISRLRTLALELLLGAHPEDCSTCPKYGNCELQTLIQYIGANNARMKNRSRGFKMNEDNPLLIHDMNRCVLCGRCVRACKRLRGVGILDYQKKDMETYIGTLHDKLLKDADCRFCTACAEVCPTGTIRDKKVYSAADGTREEVLVPCKNACPAHTDVPRYIRYVKEGKFDEAAAVIREKVPFPKALGYICNHVCELECKRKEVSEAMSIRNIKRYAAEQDTGSCWKGKGKQLADTGKKVCIVGGGPAGMTAAYYLRKQGHEVTVKEALPTVGGMMGYGIPSYRLPRNIIEEEAAVIQEAGVVIECNTKVENPTELLKEYDAVLMAIGAHTGVRLPMQGNDLEGVLLNIDFLRKASLGEETGMGRKVIVLGGGNVAFDCARTAKRLGAEEIHLACLEAREAMTADDEEIDQAQEEGIFVHPAQTFEKITGEDKVTGVDFMDVKSFTFDENRRAVIEKVEGSQHHIEGDTVIFAVGQRPDIDEHAGLELGRGNSIKVRDKSLAASTEGIFAAGDVVYGTKSVIQAIASGRDAAMEIDRYLGGDGDISEVLAPEEMPDPYIGRKEGFGYETRVQPDVVPAEERKDNFGLVDHGICSDSICGEAGRCLQCDLRVSIKQPKLWTEFSDKKEAVES